MHKIILASSSPYRKELLSRLGVDFSCISPDVNEDILKSKISNPQELSLALSKLKAQEVAKSYPDHIIIGSDQVCYFENKVLSKSGSLDKSFEILKMLSGKEHILASSYTIIYKGEELHNTNVTKLKMKNLSDETIKKYLILDNPIDCAGSYKLELFGISLFDKIDTSDHTAIIGLQLLKLGNDLEGLGVKLLSKD